MGIQMDYKALMQARREQKLASRRFLLSDQGHRPVGIPPLQYRTSGADRLDVLRSDPHAQSIARAAFEGAARTGGALVVPPNAATAGSVSICDEVVLAAEWQDSAPWERRPLVAQVAPNRELTDDWFVFIRFLAEATDVTAFYGRRGLRSLDRLMPVGTVRIEAGLVLTCEPEANAPAPLRLNVECWVEPARLHSWLVERWKLAPAPDERS